MAEKTEDYKDEEAPEGLFCDLPEVPEPVLDANLDPFRAAAIRVSAKQWTNGTVLRYHFFDRGSDGEEVRFTDGTSRFVSWVGAEGQQQIVRDAFQQWKDLDIGLEFEEVAAREDAEVRIGFMRFDGSWSYVGRDVVDFAQDPNERTMNFGWRLAGTSGRDTALHEIGHTLGLKHEHQNPNSGIVWNEAVVYETFARPPNEWSRDKTFRNVLRKIDPRTVEGSEWDSNSIMHYPFGAGLIDQPTRFQGGLDPDPNLSTDDIEWARRFYPSLAPDDEETLEPFQAHRIEIAAGEQVNFHIRPTFSRNYTIQTFGRSDVVMVLFEQRGGASHFVAGDDDSGTDLNARLNLRLERGREYVLRIRLYHAHRSGETAVFMW